MKKIIVLVTLVLGISSVSAEGYFRCNTAKCKEARLADKQARLEKELVLANNQESKKEINDEIANIKYEMDRLDVQRSSTAHAQR